MTDTQEPIPPGLADRVLFFTSKVGVPITVMAFLLFELHNFLLTITAKLAELAASETNVINLLNHYCGK